MKKSRMMIVIVLITFMVLGTFSTALAYSGSYSFNIRSSVTGTNTHSLSNEVTKTTAKGQTYNADATVSKDKSTFTVRIYKGILNYGAPAFTANNKEYTKTFRDGKKVPSGSYKVSVAKASSTGDRIKGSGKIKQ